MKLLVFDDGPAARTHLVLDELARRDVKAVFALVGDCVLERQDVARRIAADGHTIVNHTMTHARLTEISDDRVRAEIRGCENVIRDVTGVVTTVLRPPYVACDGRIAAIAAELGYSLMARSSMGDYLYQSPEELAREARSYTEFLGLHDTHEPTVRALPAILETA